MLMVFRHVYNLGHGNTSTSLPVRRVGRILWTRRLTRLAGPDSQGTQWAKRWISSSSIIHDSTRRPASRNANTPARRFPSLQEQATRCYTQPSASRLEQNKPTQPHDELHTQNDQPGLSSSQPPSRPSSPFKPPSSAAFDPSSSHHDLRSFLAHAARTGLSPTSTVYTGTLYEYSTSTTLRTYGFDLHRVGGRGDRGVDLIGLWHIPRLASRTGSSSTGEWKEHTNPSTGETTVETDTFRVLVQCKRLVGKHAKIGPNLVRELDGAVRGARLGALFDRVFGQHESQTPEATVDGSEEMGRSTGMTGPTIGVLVGTRPATKGVIEGMRRSSRALVWIMMEEAQAAPLSRVHSSKEDFDNEIVSIEATPSSAPEPSLSDETPPASDSAAESASTTEADPDPTSTHAASLPHAILGSNSNGRVKQMLWNQAARNLGLEDVNVVSRYDAAGREEVVLMRGGRVWGGS
ncbi:hypothetical protein LTR20_004302 [Exophiala xenobiotica]|nr:hypothetical protein LTR40_002666 [Exophiala xenobiotica]KAK5331408.1 hypothetical protein LTR93_000411 [Exophiala xenobiotica]KAK5359664.1 hypothetical protein LTS13_010555 [Exophiala xenobiotica]KAK5398813.1 hypothetical protein LTR79_003811 [Exophiala xenobiotica]KAK5421466.1 hypothetical protein LTR90_002956 [Exophiala xenobiotica]